MENEMDQVFKSTEHVFTHNFATYQRKLKAGPELKK